MKEKAKTSPIRVLLVEDNPGDADLVRDLLGESGDEVFEIFNATRLDDAIALLDKVSPDVVLLDLGLPDSQGLDTLARLRMAADESMSIVVLTGLDDETLGAQAIQKKAQDYLVKGRLNDGALPRTVRYSIERQRLQLGLRKLIDTNPDGIVVVDAKGMILFANPSTVEIFGRPAKDLIGDEFGFPVISGESTEINICPDRIAEMRVVDVEWHGKRASLVSLRDMTERKKAEAKLDAARQQADMANRSKTEFLANMSHELRTPLNSIIGFSDIIVHETHGSLNIREYLECAKNINDSGRHLHDLIIDILDVSRIETGNLALDEEEVDIAKVFTTCALLVKERAYHAGVKLKFDASDSLPALLADERRLKQILINLLTNAIKFTPDGGSVACKAETDEENHFVFCVSDNGIGIAPEDMEAVMSTFGQVDGSLARKYEGAGLGLPLSKRLAEEHGGTLELESEKGVGTTVTLRFPSERTLKNPPGRN